MIMSDTNKWPIKDKATTDEDEDERSHVSCMSEGVVVLRRHHHDRHLQTDNGGDVEGGDVSTEVNENDDVATKGDKEEKLLESGGGERQKEVVADDFGRNVNSSHEDDNIPNDHNDNCGNSLPPVVTTTPTPPPEQIETTRAEDVALLPPIKGRGEEGEMEMEVLGDGIVGVITADNKPPSSAAVHIPIPQSASPWPMPSPLAKPRTPGILRLDTSGKKSRRSSGISSTVEFRNDPEMLGEVSTFG